jgi:hypothetical protein
MSGLILKRILLAVTLVATVLAVGCGKDKDKEPEYFEQAKTAFNNCVRRLAYQGQDYYCYEVGPYYGCNVNQYLNGYCGHTGGAYQQYGYNPYSINSYFSGYLRQARISTYEIRDMINRWNMTY